MGVDTVLLADLIGQLRSALAVTSDSGTRPTEFQHEVICRTTAGKLTFGADQRPALDSHDATWTLELKGIQIARGSVSRDRRVHVEYQRSGFVRDVDSVVARNATRRLDDAFFDKVETHIGTERAWRSHVAASKTLDDLELFAGRRHRALLAEAAVGLPTPARRFALRLVDDGFPGTVEQLVAAATASVAPASSEPAPVPCSVAGADGAGT